MNYAYLTGILESELKNLAYDETFRKFKSAGYRLDYVQKIIAKAEAAAIEYEKKNAEKEAAYDPLEDFNYVGSRHHY